MLIPMAAQAIRTLIAGFQADLPLVFQTGGDIIGGIIGGIIAALPDIAIAILEIPAAIISGIMQTDWLEVGKSILNGIKDGVLGGAASIWDKLTGGGADASAGQNRARRWPRISVTGCRRSRARYRAPWIR